MGQACGTLIKKNQGRGGGGDLSRMLWAGREVGIGGIFRPLFLVRAIVNCEPQCVKTEPATDRNFSHLKF